MIDQSGDSQSALQPWPNILPVMESMGARHRVTGLTHSFYRYPARFSPAFARAAIDALSAPGDLVLDPFMGGGTTAVEALASGRRVVGTDLNRLAIFAARAKTTLITRTEGSVLTCWADSLEEVTAAAWSTPTGPSAINRHVPWPLRKTLSLALTLIEGIRGPRVRTLARASLLRAGQWALDGRRVTPSRAEFMARHRVLTHEMARAALSLTDMATGSFGLRRGGAQSQRRLAHSAAQHLATSQAIPNSWGAPKLIVTSPPYHGVHILYHRWQVRGRRETPAPYWVAGCSDGKGAGHYTFGGRDRSKGQRIREDYFAQALESFRAIAAVCSPATTIVQLVGFSDPTTQLPLYRQVLREAGLREITPPQSGATLAVTTREVPNRKWYLDALGRLTPSGKEYLLMHQLAR